MRNEIVEIPASAGGAGTTKKDVRTTASARLSPAPTIPTKEGATGTTTIGSSAATTNRMSPVANYPSNGSRVGHREDVLRDHMSIADPAVIVEIREQWRRRQAWHRAEKSLTLQAKALCRRLAGGEVKDADKLFNAAHGKGSHPLADVAFVATFPLIEARNSVSKHRAAVEKRLVKLAKSLPVAPWVDSVRGVGLASLAAIVGEAGDLACYPSPAHLWKRMGLAVMSDGRQRRVAGAAALDHGYSPGRRSVMWNIGSCIIKAGGPLKANYDARKVIEAAKVETKAHAHNRAQRHVEKQFLRQLWRAWNRGDQYFAAQ